MMHMLVILLLISATGSPFAVVGSFEIQRWQPKLSRQQVVISSLHAKSKSKSKRSNGGGQEQQRRLGGWISNDKNDLKSLQASVPKSSQTRSVVFSFGLLSKQRRDNEAQSPSPPQVLHVTAVQVNDPAWWNENNNAQVNPYGARLWPSSYAIAQFLASYLSSSSPPSSSKMNNNNTTSQQPLPPAFVLELGCGVGLVSLVAVQAGATVLATDISPMALSLTQQGWMATKKKRNTKKEDEDAKNGAEQGVVRQGSFSTSIFDIFSTNPLPLPLPATATATAAESTTFLNTTQNHPTNTPPHQQRQQHQLIVIAGAMLYDAILALALARRVVEAVNDFGAWVIVGDDDTGERDGGRAIFLQEMERQKLLPVSQTQGVVQHAGLGWSEKHVRLLHFNAPSHAIIQIAEDRVPEVGI